MVDPGGQDEDFVAEFISSKRKVYTFSSIRGLENPKNRKVVCINRCNLYVDLESAIFQS